MGLISCVPAGSQEVRPGYPGWAIQFTFNRETIERLKKTIPPQSREWWAENKTWWISIDEEAGLRKVFPDFDLYAHAPELPLPGVLPRAEAAKRGKEAVDYLWGPEDLWEKKKEGKE